MAHKLAAILSAMLVGFSYASVTSADVTSEKTQEIIPFYVLDNGEPSEYAYHAWVWHDATNDIDFVFSQWGNWRTCQSPVHPSGPAKTCKVMVFASCSNGSRRAGTQTGNWVNASDSTPNLSCPKGWEATNPRVQLKCDNEEITFTYFSYPNCNNWVWFPIRE